MHCVQLLKITTVKCMSFTMWILGLELWSLGSAATASPFAFLPAPLPAFYMFLRVQAQMLGLTQQVLWAQKPLLGPQLSIFKERKRLDFTVLEISGMRNPFSKNKKKKSKQRAIPYNYPNALPCHFLFHYSYFL